MLKQILRDMYVDPEILAGLDETYKQTLFCKMREEQIRRWKVWDEEQKKLETSLNYENQQNNISSSHKKVDFKLGDDGEPWVWIMGEHPDDISIEDILEEEAKKTARELAENEFRENVETNLSNIMSDCDNNDKDKTPETETPKIEDLQIYCTVDELKDMMNKSQTQPSLNLETANNDLANNNNLSNNFSSSTINNNVNRFTNMSLSSSHTNNKKDVLKEITYKDFKYNKPKVGEVSVRIAQWERNSIGQRTSEIFIEIQKKKQEDVKKAEEAVVKDEELWKEQEKKAKEAEVKMRDIARRAREEHRKSLSSEELVSLSNSFRPKNKEAVIDWYKSVERARHAGLTKDDKPEKWFHGLLERTKAETLLQNEEPGTFLVRISEKVWGYAISYKDVDRCKHYLVDASSNEKYQFLGKNQMQHDSLNELVAYHFSTPITVLGNELLLQPCKNDSEAEGFEELLV